jgi:hypothetical protein
MQASCFFLLCDPSEGVHVIITANAVDSKLCVMYQNIESHSARRSPAMLSFHSSYESQGRCYQAQSRI